MYPVGSTDWISKIEQVSNNYEYLHHKVSAQYKHIYVSREEQLKKANATNNVMHMR